MPRAPHIKRRTLNDGPPPRNRGCDWPGCGGEGDYRAPKTRALNAYYWFCLDHVRSYNAAWNYYEGMSRDEIEHAIQEDVTWGRPTWQLGAKVGGRSQAFGAHVHDPFGVYEHGEAPVSETARSALPGPVRAALAELDLGWPVSRVELKARYKELSKRTHPDATGGDKKAEERFKRVALAHGELTRYLDGLEAG